MDLSRLLSYSHWVEIVGSEFRLGFLCALAIVGAIFVALLLLQIILYLGLRRGGAKEVVARHPDGDVVVAKAAVVSAIAAVCRDRGGLAVRKLDIYALRRGKYSFKIYAAMTGGEVDDGLTSLKAAIRESLQGNFGIERVEKTDFTLEKFSAAGSAEAPRSQDESPADPGIGKSPAAGTAPQADD